MKIFRLSTLTALALSVASGFVLFSTAQEVQQTDGELKRMKAAVAQEEQTIRVLRAEWDYLNRPDRLEALVKNNLELTPAKPESVRGKHSDFPDSYSPVVPARKPSLSTPVMKAIPAVHDLSAPLPKPAAPQSPAVPPSELPRKDFQKLLNDLSPATGGAP